MNSMYNKNAGHGITGSKNVFSTKVHLGNWREDIIGKELVQDILTNIDEAAQLGRSNGEPHPGGLSRDLISRNKRNSYSTSSQAIGSRLQTKRNIDVSTSLPPQDELKAKNKEGLNYFLLFSHTNNGEDISHRNRYTSQNRLSSSHHLLRSRVAGLSESRSLDCEAPETDTGQIGTRPGSKSRTQMMQISVDSMFPPVDFSYTKNKNKIIKNDSELNLKMTTTARLANKFLSQYPPDRYSAPYNAVGRSEFLPSARR